MDFDVVWHWKEGSTHNVSGALSRLPLLASPAGDMDDSFPDDPSSAEPSEDVEPQGPILDELMFRDLEIEVEVITPPITFAAFITVMVGQPPNPTATEPPPIISTCFRFLSRKCSSKRDVNITKAPTLWA